MSDYSKFMEKAKAIFSNKEDVYAILIYNDLFEVITFKELTDIQVRVDHLLDIRVFDENQELRIYRDYVGSDFYDIVNICDSVLDKCERYCDYQYIDIDMKKTKKDSGFVYATGGGKYKFPIIPTEFTKVKIVNYIDYDSEGQAYIKAWRVAGFTNEKMGVENNEI